MAWIQSRTENEIWALRNLNNNRGNQKEIGDDIRSLGHSAAGFTNNERQVIQLVQVPALLPPPMGVQPPAPPDGRINATTGGYGTRSSNAGNAFGCNGLVCNHIWSLLLLLCVVVYHKASSNPRKMTSIT